MSVPSFEALTRQRGLLYGGDYNPEQWSPDVWREDVALMVAEVVERGREAGSCVELAGGVVGEDPTGAGGRELVDLGVEDLVEGRHSGVADDGHQRSYPSRRGLVVFCPAARPLGP